MILHIRLSKSLLKGGGMKEREGERERERERGDENNILFYFSTAQVIHTQLSLSPQSAEEAIA